MPALLALFLSFAPAFGYAALVYWLDRYEKEPLVLLGGVFAWGALVATIGAIVAQVFLEGAVHLATGSPEAADLAGTTVFAPLTEESLKGLAVLAVFLLLRREFDSLLDGLVYAGVVALGFAATENVLYLLDAFTREGLAGMTALFGLRVLLGAWDHPLYTAFIGIGLAIARTTRAPALRIAAPIAGWAVAVFVHSLHNTLATFGATVGALAGLMFMVDWGGWLAIGLLILWAIHREGRLLGEHLAEEMGTGLVTAAQYRVATSSWAQTGARLRALQAGRYGATRRFYQTCGELAHKKRQLARDGEERGNAAAVARLRGELERLSPQALA